MAELQHVAGLDELKKTLQQLPDRIAKNVLRGAVYAGAKVIAKEVKVKAPVFTGVAAKNHPPAGTLKRSIYSKQIPELSSLTRQTFYVGARRGKQYRNQGKTGNLSQDAYYAAFVEFGTSKMAAKPFLRPAFEAKKNEAVEAIRAYLAERIPRELEALVPKK